MNAKSKVIDAARTIDACPLFRDTADLGGPAETNVSTRERAQKSPTIVAAEGWVESDASDLTGAPRYLASDLDLGAVNTVKSDDDPIVDVAGGRTCRGIHGYFDPNGDVVAVQAAIASVLQ